MRHRAPYRPHPRSTTSEQISLPLNPEETKEIQRQVKHLIDHGHVHESLSPCAVPVILVPKRDGSFRMCFDCRPINAITVRYRYPIPRLDDMHDDLVVPLSFPKLILRVVTIKSAYKRVMNGKPLPKPSLAYMNG